jgi:hypothetical protein
LKWLIFVFTNFTNFVSLFFLNSAITLKSSAKPASSSSSLFQSIKPAASSASNSTPLLMVNRAGVSVERGSGKRVDFIYCGRNLGKKILPPTGVCGPQKGPQCPDCRGLSISKSKALAKQANASKELNLDVARMF